MLEGDRPRRLPLPDPHDPEDGQPEGTSSGRSPAWIQLPADVNLDDRELVKIEAMILSFTKFEKKDPYALIREPEP